MSTKWTPPGSPVIQPDHNSTLSLSRWGCWWSDLYPEPLVFSWIGGQRGGTPRDCVLLPPYSSMLRSVTALGSRWTQFCCFYLLLIQIRLDFCLFLAWYTDIYDSSTLSVRNQLSAVRGHDSLVQYWYPVQPVVTQVEEVFREMLYLLLFSNGIFTNIIASDVTKWSWSYLDFKC